MDIMLYNYSSEYHLRGYSVVTHLVNKCRHNARLSAKVNATAAPNIHMHIVRRNLQQYAKVKPEIDLSFSSNHILATCSFSY